MALSAYYAPPPSTESDTHRLTILDHIYASGQRFWDTANIYGDNEQLIGKWLARNPHARGTLFLATKFGAVGGGKGRNDAGYARECCEESLRRLGTDYIDLFYVHRVDTEVPVEVSMGGEGKVRYLGLSEVSAETLRRAHAVYPIAAVQMEYSLFALDVEAEFLQTTKELGVALVAYSPLSRGLLSGRFKSHDDIDEDDFRKRLPRFSPENFPKNLELAEKIHAVADRKGVTASQLALAWLLAQGENVIPIPGTKSIEYYDENMGALDVELNDEDLRELRAAVEEADVKGGRYPVTVQSGLFADTPPLET
ncbi:NADP-dependent oxidoreductase domain-containing protein [Aspergillus avenaceus]|uniref:NADP-dependent oxidoreductase domain-containing protein n=1 Tax=Aspergillus avenaceus TaxID=36643 RepID=A0A5N6TF75_ASPAV|nr:NADP-dependent oxidoreductase domain-containing protein [Aspergillus avenaceus]